MYTYMHILFHHCLSRDPEYSAPCSAVGPFCLPILCMSRHLLPQTPSPVLASLSPGHRKPALRVCEPVSVLRMSSFASRFKPRIRDIVWCLFFSVCLTSHGMIISIHVAVKGIALLFFMTEACSILYTHTHTHTHIYIYIKKYINAGDPDLIPGQGRSPGEGNGNPLQYSCLAWRIPRTEETGRYSPWDPESQRLSD